MLPNRNELERSYQHLQFNINVHSRMYAKYYFDLRSLAEDNAGLTFPNEYEPLTKERAKKLEVIMLEYVQIAIVLIRQNTILLQLYWDCLQNSNLAFLGSLRPQF